jgi:hypothetical protein
MIGPSVGHSLNVPVGRRYSESLILGRQFRNPAKSPLGVRGPISRHIGSYPCSVQLATCAEQAARETELERFLESIQSECRSLPHTRPARRVAHDRITSAFVRFAGSGLNLESRHLDLLLGGGFAVIGTDLVRQARRFNPAISTADILQASRNAWAACAL